MGYMTVKPSLPIVGTICVIMIQFISHVYPDFHASHSCCTKLLYCWYQILLHHSYLYRYYCNTYNVVGHKTPNSWKQLQTSPIHLPGEEMIIPRGSSPFPPVGLKIAKDVCTGILAKASPSEFPICFYKKLKKSTSAIEFNRYVWILGLNAYYALLLENRFLGDRRQIPEKNPPSHN